ncbi:molybdenum cofactor synthesis 1 [Melioribacter roseus P3M-2]|uniref:Molybdenum cofactor synthesis 1 n=1 Tax=Melioribacter roseus (strain DSM 23840 / JCM 17771 / VKM B-2668 / P3M-2) TaxID=1191523 RepID=I6ZZ80_MELRP|nr:GTP 3',8-cyclase MoaA [Melioribacter roseus]AFN74318.1 molybdenum cofactor synthesis 1 [Melioribacter roseus P3M-2]
MKLTDKFGRIHDYVRISLIDKCYFNCIYCNPSNSPARYDTNKSILSYEELYRLIRILVRNLEVKKIRFTGGEPLIRKNVINFFEMIYPLKKQYGFEIGITTNGARLSDKIESLKNFGVDKLNISLDTLNRNKFIAITGKDYFVQTLSAIEKATGLNFKSVKVNVVVIKNINDEELTDFVEYFKSHPVTLRFIEYMPFAGNQWDDSKFFSWNGMKTQIEKKYSLKEIDGDGKVSKDFLVEGENLKLGFISSISDHFCDGCNRLRITATGKIKNCLFANPSELSLKSLLMDESITDETIVEFIRNTLKSKWIKHPSAKELAELNQNNMMSIGG